MTKAEFTLGKHNFFMFQTAYRDFFMDDLYWLQLVNYNFIQDVISFFRNFFDQDKLQEHIKKYQEKTDNET